jgi:transcriptional regulator with XRE-family HTH domain
MDLNKKIEQIIVDKGMSPSFFADAIGVQRSSISHILSGRNKPSLDIIQKILRVFPDINRDWLLFDTETPYDNQAINSDTISCISASYTSIERTQRTRIE